MDNETKKKINIALLGLIAAIAVIVYFSRSSTRKEADAAWVVQSLGYDAPDKKWRQVGMVQMISSGKIFFGKSVDMPVGWGKEKYTMSGGLHAVSFTFPTESGEGFSITVDKDIVSRNGKTAIHRRMCETPGGRRITIDVNIAGKWYQLSDKFADCNDVDGEIIVDDKTVEIIFSLTLGGEKFKGQGKFIKRNP